VIQLRKAHIHYFVFWKHGIKVMQKFDELLGGLNSVSGGKEEDTQMVQTSAKPCA
jgi:hypothetical protein